MTRFIEGLRDAGPLRATGVGNTASDGVAQAATMAQDEDWTNHLLQLRNDLREALGDVVRRPGQGWNETSARVGPRVDAEIRPVIEAYARENRLGEAFVKAVRYAVMTAAMADEYRADATVPDIDAVADALLAGRLPCGFRNGALITY